MSIVNIHYWLQRIIILPLSLYLLAITNVAAYNFAPLTSRITDQANLLPPQIEANLVAKLKQHEAKTTNQVIVVTVKSLEDRSIEEYGVELGRHWGIGQKSKNNGVILLIAPNERKVRIDVGYGLEGLLTDALCASIIWNRITPAFKKGDFAGGIQSGIDAILAVLNKDIPEDLKKPVVTDGLEILLMPLLYLSFFASFILSPFVPSHNAFAPAAFLGITGGTIVGFLASSLLIGALFGIFLFGMIFLTAGRMQYASGRDIGSYYPRSRTRGQDTFSGGGGSFGGGGASGGW